MLNNQGGGQEFTDATAGGSPIGGSGTTNTIAKFTAANSIGDSHITDNGTVITMTGTTFAWSGSGAATFAGTTFAVNASTSTTLSSPITYFNSANSYVATSATVAWQSATATVGNPQYSSGILEMDSSNWNGASADQCVLTFQNYQPASGSPQYICKAFGLEQWHFLTTNATNGNRLWVNPSTSSASFQGWASPNLTVTCGVGGNSYAALSYGSDYVQADATGVVLHGTAGTIGITTYGNCRPVSHGVYTWGDATNSFLSTRQGVVFGYDMVSAQSNPATTHGVNQGILYFRTVASSKLSLCVVYPSGAEQILGTEP